jgi:hypothetical protein
MKTNLSLALAAGIVCASLFTSCAKENMKPAESVNAENSSNATTGEDRIDAIVSDLSIDSYSLSFTKTYLKSGITKRAYGTDNYLAFADPQDLICGDPIRLKYKQIPIWKRPNIIWPTCPDMVLDINKLTEIQKVIVSADPKLYEGLQQVKFLNPCGGFLATQVFTKQFPAMKLDKIDDATSKLSLDKFLMLNNPANLGSGATRSFYGYADLNEIVFKPYKKSLKDILKPTLKGCFDPETLKILRSQLQKVDPAYYSNLAITYLPENKQIAILSVKQ